MTATGTAETCPTLLSWERELLVQYLRLTPEQRQVVLRQAINDPKASGSFIIALQWARTA